MDVLNQDTMIVTVETQFDTFDVSYLEYFARSFVVEHLHWHGRYQCILTGLERNEMYVLCDGFDHVPKHYDWSHVRDSSYATMLKIAEMISSKKWRLNFENFINQLLDDCRENDLHPMQVVPGSW